MKNKMTLVTILFAVVTFASLLSCDEGGGTSADATAAPPSSPEYDMTTGRLSYLDYYYTPPGAGGLVTEHIRFSPDGRNAYVTTNFDDYLLWFSVDADTGALSIRGSWSYSSASGMRDCVISPDGCNVYISARDANIVTWFTRDPDTGDLTREADDEFDGPELVEPQNMAMSPDGLSLYVLRAYDDSVVWFSRDAGTGDLTCEGSLTDERIDSSYIIAVSPDNNFVYIPSAANGSIVCYSRDMTTGGLTYSGSYVDPDGQLNIRGILITPDGRHLYAGSDNTNDGSVLWFSRDPATGEITFAGSFTSRLLYLCRIAASGDWANIYATGENGSFDYGAVFCFAINGETGALKFIQSVSGWEIPNELLERGMDIAVSPDDGFVYTVWRNITEDRRGVLWFSREE